MTRNPSRSSATYRASDCLLGHRRLAFFVKRTRLTTFNKCHLLRRDVFTANGRCCRIGRSPQHRDGISSTPFALES